MNLCADQAAFRRLQTQRAASAIKTLGFPRLPGEGAGARNQDGPILHQRRSRDFLIYESH